MTQFRTIVCFPAAQESRWFQRQEGSTSLLPVSKLRLQEVL